MRLLSHAPQSNKNASVRTLTQPHPLSPWKEKKNVTIVTQSTRDDIHYILSSSLPERSPASRDILKLTPTAWSLCSVISWFTCAKQMQPLRNTERTHAGRVVSVSVLGSASSRGSEVPQWLSGTTLHRNLYTPTWTKRTVKVELSTNRSYFASRRANWAESPDSPPHPHPTVDKRKTPPRERQRQDSKFVDHFKSDCGTTHQSMREHECQPGLRKYLVMKDNIRLAPHPQLPENTVWRTTPFGKYYFEVEAVFAGFEPGLKYGLCFRPQWYKNTHPNRKTKRAVRICEMRQYNINKK